MGHPRVAIDCSRHTEIEDLGLAGFIDEDIARFEIAVDDTALMGVFNPFADAGHELQPLVSCQLMRIGVFEQGLTMDEFHGEIRLWSETIVSSARFIDLCNARMLQSSQRKQFLLEAADQLGIA